MALATLDFKDSCPTWLVLERWCEIEPTKNYTKPCVLDSPIKRVWTTLCPKKSSMRVYFMLNALPHLLFFTRFLAGTRQTL
jgi:hypothetical protein